MSVLFGQEWQCLGEGSCPSNLVPTLNDRRQLNFLPATIKIPGDGGT